MKVDLTAINFTGEEAASYRVRYARIDNTTTPVFLVAGNPTAVQFPYTIPNVDNGQYRIGITSNYSDGRVCQEFTEDTAACQGIIALNAVQSGSNLEITYTAPGQAPQVYLTVIYPNGGSFIGAYTNGANDSTILVPIPSGVNGVYQVYMQSICDPNTGFYSGLTPPVNVTVGSDTVLVSSDAAGIVITDISGISGYSLSQSLAAGNSDTGTHGTFTGTIAAIFTGTPLLNCNAYLTVNNVFVQCRNIPNTNGGNVSFDSRTYYSTDIINVSFNLGACV